MPFLGKADPIYTCILRNKQIVLLMSKRLKKSNCGGKPNLVFTSPFLENCLLSAFLVAFVGILAGFKCFNGSACTIFLVHCTHTLLLGHP